MVIFSTSFVTSLIEVVSQVTLRWVVQALRVSRYTVGLSHNVLWSLSGLTFIKMYRGSHPVQVWFFGQIEHISPVFQCQSKSFFCSLRGSRLAVVFYVHKQIPGRRKCSVDLSKTGEIVIARKFKAVGLSRR